MDELKLFIKKMQSDMNFYKNSVNKEHRMYLPWEYGYQILDEVLKKIDRIEKDSDA